MSGFVAQKWFSHEGVFASHQRRPCIRRHSVVLPLRKVLVFLLRITELQYYLHHQFPFTALTAMRASEATEQLLPHHVGTAGLFVVVTWMPVVCYLW